MPVLNEADDVRFGAAQVDAIYAGAEKVWPGGGPPVSAGLTVWLDATVAGSFDVPSGKISYWDSLVAPFTRFTASVGGDVYRGDSTSPSGEPLVATFSGGVDQSMLRSSGAWMRDPTTGAFTVMAVLKGDAQFEFINFLEGTGGDPNGVRVYEMLNPLRGQERNMVASATGNPTTALCVCAMVSDAVTKWTTMFFNNVAGTPGTWVLTDDYPTDNTQTMQLFNGTGAGAWGRIGELMVWDRPLDAAELTETFDYLVPKWGVSV